MTEQYANDFLTTLASGISEADVAVTLTDAPPNPLTSGQWRLRVDNEIMLVTSVSGKECSVTRAAESVAGVEASASHAAGATAEHVLSSASLLALAFTPADLDALGGITASF